jgi:uncharacterized OB-fold protein
MKWGSRPVPEVTPETEHYWEAATKETLLIGDCQDCGEQFFFPRAVCPHCLSVDAGTAEAAGTGTLYTYSVSHQLAGWPQEDLPLVNALIELDEGVRMFSILVEVDTEEISIGDAVEVRFAEREEDSIAIPVFILA